MKLRKDKKRFWKIGKRHTKGKKKHLIRLLMQDAQLDKLKWQHSKIIESQKQH